MIMVDLDFDGMIINYSDKGCFSIDWTLSAKFFSALDLLLIYCSLEEGF